MRYSNAGTVLLMGEPKGKFLSGRVSGTPSPGTNMQIKATAFIGGKPVWEVAAPSGGDGKPCLIAILVEDFDQGKGISDAYVSGTECQVYCPIAGEDMLVRVGEGGGTSNTLAIGDLVMSDAEDGIFVPNSSGTSVPWQVCETVTQQADTTLVWCKYTGH